MYAGTAGGNQTTPCRRVRLARTFRMTESWHEGESVYGSYAAAVVAAPFRNFSRSELIVSASVVGMPCGKLL
jgi:hypothetical protein